ncbi:MAG TPA: acetate--CoA ligase family protein [Spirochaetota bacterium]|nr:acetate--CoA ligase family protein [Spirochaetota bacterium]HPI90890.1 acetate--CoA ligase family protein [Spirochaetota bacterium]
MDRKNKTLGYEQLDRMFDPKSIAIIGVAEEGFSFGRGMLLSHLSIGYAGKLYPVNRRGGTIEGMTIYPSVEDIPGPVDFAIIAVPAKYVPDAVESCLNKGAAGVEILSSGFREMGTPEGIALEEQVQAIAARGIRVLGPNCFGIYCPRSGQTLLPGPNLSREPGGVAFLSQSGGHSIDFGLIGTWRGVRFSKVVSFGNGCDLRETEMLGYLTRDPETTVICMYIEGIADGQAFVPALEAACREKPVLVIKGGLSDSGSRAAASHTASMGGKKNIWEAALRQCNAVQVADMEHMVDSSLAFSLLPHRSYLGCSIVGGGGALGIAAADAAESFGLSIPPLREDLKDSIMEILPKPGSSAANPIDVANPFVPPQTIREIILRASQDDAIDIHILVFLIYHFRAHKDVMSALKLRDFVPFREMARACREVRETTGKPVVLVMPNYRQEEEALDLEEIVRETRKEFLNAGIPVYDDVTNALRAIASVSRYHRRRTLIAEAVPAINTPGSGAAQKTSLPEQCRDSIREALRRGETSLNEYESKRVLEAYSIPVTGERVVNSIDEALSVAREIGYPVALKGSSRALTHKTEHRLIELGIKGEAALEKAYRDIEARGKGQLDGMLVQQMVRGDREFVAGLIRDPQFGPCVMFGLGGIYTEVLKDVSFRVAPLRLEDAYDMLNEIRAVKLLDEFRGKPAVDREVLARILVSLGRIGLENREISEIDVNPLIISDGRPVAVDALVVLKKD